MPKSLGNLVKVLMQQLGSGGGVGGGHPRLCINKLPGDANAAVHGGHSMAGHLGVCSLRSAVSAAHN